MGERFELSGAIDGNSQRAMVNQVGASLRRLVVNGVELVQGYPQEIAAPRLPALRWFLGPTGWPGVHGPTGSMMSSLRSRSQPAATPFMAYCGIAAIVRSNAP